MTQEVANKLAPEKLYQISMDGPKVNWSFTGKYKQSALKVFTIHLLIWALVVCKSLPKYKKDNGMLEKPPKVQKTDM